MDPVADQRFNILDANEEHPRERCYTAYGEYVFAEVALALEKEVERLRSENFGLQAQVRQLESEVLAYRNSL